MMKIVFTVTENKWLHCRQIATRAIIYIAPIRGEMVAQLAIYLTSYVRWHTQLSILAMESSKLASQLSGHATNCLWSLIVLAAPNASSDYVVNWLYPFSLLYEWVISNQVNSN